MLVRGFGHARLMEESELRVQMSTYLHTPADAAARRMLQCPETYQRWEVEHDRLLHAISDRGRLAEQVTALRSTVFALVHRRAVFEYLREAQVTGEKRRRALALFYRCRDYTDAVLREHANYVRCSSSYLCTYHLGEHLMHDAAFYEPLVLYEEWYTEYFRAYCDSELAETEQEKEASVTLDALKPLLKHRLAEARQAILAMPQSPDREWREVEIRKPNGDTQRMRTIFGKH
ncbi:MAG TPA: hypothetical protein VE266_11510 [Steroidobacteraceae bacterium]|jgi:hypothetical protein|nr:hypothetical protein [Steroidobacteraceae bacterium]